MILRVSSQLRKGSVVQAKEKLSLHTICLPFTDIHHRYIPVPPPQYQHKRLHLGCYRTPYFPELTLISTNRPTLHLLSLHLHCRPWVACSRFTFSHTFHVSHCWITPTAIAVKSLLYSSPCQLLSGWSPVACGVGGDILTEAGIHGVTTAQYETNNHLLVYDSHD